MICIDKNKVEFSMDKNSIPVAYADSGSEVTFACRDCYHDQILSDRFEFEKINMKLNNPATGPLYINGATPGDMLKVFIKKIDISNSGVMCVRTGSGIYEIEGCHCRQFDIKDRNIIFDNNILIPIAPMVGVIGTAPKDEPISTQCPGEHGGNLDIKDLGEGAVLFLPVNVEGGLLYMGDIHAVQGDGETAICALEVGGKVTVKVDVIKKTEGIPAPFIITEKNYITTAASTTLDESSVIASRKMHKFLIEHTELDESQCGMLLSLAGNLRISQVVNPLKGCIMEFPRGLAGEKFSL